MSCGVLTGPVRQCIQLPRIQLNEAPLVACCEHSHGLAMIHGRSWRGGPGERELMDLSPAEGTTRPDFFWVAYTSRRSVSLRLVYADGSPCGGRHAQGCPWGPVPCGIDPIQCSSAQVLKGSETLAAEDWQIAPGLLPNVEKSRQLTSSAASAEERQQRPDDPSTGPRRRRSSPPHAKQQVLQARV